MFNNNVDLLKGRILRSLIIFAIPIFVSNLFQQLYNTADIIIIGNYLGANALAAIGAGAAIYELLVGFSLGVGNGLSIVTSRGYGSSNENLVKKSVASSIVIGIGITGIVMIISKLFLYPLLRLVNTPENIIEQSHAYLSIISMFIGVMFLYNLCAGFLRAVGNSVMPLIFLIISSIINIVLDIVFVTEFNMGIEGVAYATVIAQAISGVLCITYIIKKCPILIPGKEHFTFDRALYRDLLGQGLSIGIMLLIVSIGTVILQASINGFGHLIIAGHTTARKVGGFIMIPVSALSMSLATFVSQNKGANQNLRIRKAIFSANMLSIAWAVISTIILMFFAEPLIRILSGSSEEILLSNGSRYVLFNAPFYAVLGMLLNFRNSLQGIGEKVLPLISSIIEFFGKILFVLILIPKLGYFGVIIVEPIIWCVMCAQLAYSFYKNKFIRDIDEDENIKSA